MWPTLENVLCTLGKDASSLLGGRCSSCLLVFCRAAQNVLPLLLFCLDHRAISESSVWNLPAVPTLLPVTFFRSINIYFASWGTKTPNAYMWIIAMSSYWLTLLLLLSDLCQSDCLFCDMSTTACLFWFPFEWTTFSYPFTYSFHVPFTLKWVSFRQSVAESFKKSIQPLCLFWLASLIHLYLK